MAPRETHGHVNLGGFCTLPVKFNERSSAFHVVYYKKHVVRQEEEDLPAERTLFAVNIPPYCTKAAVKELFSQYGEVKNVFIQKQPGKVRREVESSLVDVAERVKGFKMAYVVYKKINSATKAVSQVTNQVSVLSTAERPIVTGIAKWCREYAESYPDTEKLQSEVDDFMAKFDKEKQELEDERKQQREADDEGWITVTRGGRNPAAPRTSGPSEKNSRKGRKKKKKDLINFYQFQQRESKREHIAQLRKKFEDDKMRISQMKAARKFRPY